MREIRGTGREHFGPMPNPALQRTLLWWKNSALRKNSALLENSAVVVGAHKCYKWMAGGSEGLGRPPLENCNKSTRRESRCERSRVTTWRATHIFKQSKTRMDGKWRIGIKPKKKGTKSHCLYLLYHWSCSLYTPSTPWDICLIVCASACVFHGGL